ncbi:NAD(P)-dependent oxidoreductase [Rathayibacter sp. YIM 133350]|uniref:NAD(P)-dependent oxidoreductase n=1 Tax=Rathayibacter sp. YIM 133350 TaxID=3131992 RepID=UPI00307F9ABC
MRRRQGRRSDMAIGFLGLGVMGEPMALNLVESGVDLVVWNRSEPARQRLASAGASAAASVDEVFERAETVIVMLATEAAIDETLGRGTDAFGRRLHGRTLVSMGTNSPEYSRSLEGEVLAVGGAYVEAPVSGSRTPAEKRQLVGMLAGDPHAVARVRGTVELLCAQTFECGAVPSATLMKLAANSFLISLVTGLAEAFAFAEAAGLDAGLLRSILDGGQMASPVSAAKTAKLVGGDLSPQARIRDVLKNAQLVSDAAAAAGVASPLIDASRDLYAAATDAGDGDLDMVGVTDAIRRQGRASRG